MAEVPRDPYSRRQFLTAGAALAMAAGETVRPGAQGMEQTSADIETQLIPLKAEDGVTSRGIFYKKRGPDPKVAIISSHPTGDNSEDWKCGALAERGIAGFGLRHRYSRNEEQHIHEEILLDLAAAVRYLKKERGIPMVVLLGHSGGGQLSAMYQSQATAAPPNRVASTPAGDPPDLNKYDLPPVDGVILSAAHPGRPEIFRDRLDPAVVDENNPFASDPDLDMFDPRNGFKMPPESSKYSQAFISRFKAGQQARLERLDALARNMVQEEKFYKQLVAAPDFSQRPLHERLALERRSIDCHWIIMRRVQADLHWTDMSCDPSDRIVRTTGPYSLRPDLANYSIFREPYIQSPRSFLSSRSSISSNANMWKAEGGKVTPLNLRKVTVPADEQVSGLERHRTHLEVSGSADRSIVWVVGADHGYRPSGPKAGAGRQRDEAADKMSEWILKRFRSS
jgi:pimeloyl-ACP methyl ester carboxylesterase